MLLKNRVKVERVLEQRGCPSFPLWTCPRSICLKVGWSGKASWRRWGWSWGLNGEEPAVEVSRQNNIPLGEANEKGHGVTGDEVTSSQADTVCGAVRVVTQEDMWGLFLEEGSPAPPFLPRLGDQKELCSGDLCIKIWSLHFVVVLRHRLFL